MNDQELKDLNKDLTTLIFNQDLNLAVCKECQSDQIIEVTTYSGCDVTSFYNKNTQEEIDERIDYYGDSTEYYYICNDCNSSISEDDIRILEDIGFF